MKLCIIITLLLGGATVALGQDMELDSLGFPLKQTNLLNTSADPIDSIQSSFNNKFDSLKQRYRSRFSKLDSSQAVWQSKLDKLRSIKVPTKKLGSNNKSDSLAFGGRSKMDSVSLSLQENKITSKIDSLNVLREKSLTNLNKELQSLKNKTTEKLNELKLPGEMNDKISEVQSKIGDLKIPESDLTLPSLNTGQNSMGSLKNFTVESPALNLNSPAVDVGKVAPLSNVPGEIGGASELIGKAGGYGEDIQKIAQGNLSELQELPNTAEEKAIELAGVEGMDKQTQALDQYKDQAAQMQNPDSLKQFAVQEVRQYAINHFAGKEEQLQQAMETVSKYKTKYSSVNGMADLTKRPPNEMRGKPLMERIVPGLAIQLQKRGGELLVDFNPYAGYRFTRRLTAGAGWNQRVAYNTNKNYFNADARIYGPRIFGEFKLWKGFSPRAECEVMNTMVPTLPRAPSLDPGTREWVWGAFVGMKKEYKFIRSVKGTALIMVRLYNPEHKSPYGDVLNVRFGFEFPMKKKLKTS